MRFSHQKVLFSHKGVQNFPFYGRCNCNPIGGLCFCHIPTIGPFQYEFPRKGHTNPRHLTGGLWIVVELKLQYSFCHFLFDSFLRSKITKFDWINILISFCQSPQGPWISVTAHLELIIFIGRPFLTSHDKSLLRVRNHFTISVLTFADSCLG